MRLVKKIQHKVYKPHNLLSQLFTLLMLGVGVAGHCHIQLPQVSFTYKKMPNIIIMNINNKHGYC